MLVLALKLMKWNVKTKFIDFTINLGDFTYNNYLIYLKIINFKIKQNQIV